MKTKIKYILRTTVVFALLIITACTKDGLLPSDSAKDAGDSSEEAYISVTVRTVREAISKAVDDFDYGEASEYQVENVRMVLYDAVNPDPTVKYEFDFNIRSIADEPWYEDDDQAEMEDLYEGGPMEKFAFVTFAREIVRDDYRMLIIINAREKSDVPPPEQAIGPRPNMVSPLTRSGEDLYELTRPGKKLSDFMAPVTIPEGDIVDFYSHHKGIAVDGNFLMTNAQGLIPISSSELKSTPDEANKAPFPVSVDRTVAKVIVDIKSDVPVVGGTAVAGSFAWKMDITNLKTYWMRNMDRVMSLDGSTQAPETPGNERRIWYAKDPNFTGFSEHNGGTISLRYENFNYTTNDDFLKEGSALGGGGGKNKVKPPEDGNFIYVLENTMEGDEQYEDVMTRALIKLQYVPTSSATGTFTDNDSYYIFGGYAISLSNMARYKDEGDHPTNNPELPEILGIQAAIQAAEIELESAIPVEDEGDINLPPYPFQSESGIRFYRNGWNIYKVPIRHFDYDESILQSNPYVYGRYGVIRNNVYTVTVTSIEGPGGPTVESAGMYISAGVNIVPWLEISQNTDLETSGTIAFPAVTYNYYYNTSASKNDSANDYTLLATTYNKMLFEGATIPVSTTVLNAKKDNIPGGAAGYKDGALKNLHGTIPTKVSSDNSKNIVNIYYDKIPTPTHTVTFVYQRAGAGASGPKLIADKTKECEQGEELTLVGLRSSGYVPEYLVGDDGNNYSYTSSLPNLSATVTVTGDMTVYVYYDAFDPGSNKFLRYVYKLEDTSGAEIHARDLIIMDQDYYTPYDAPNYTIPGYAYKGVKVVYPSSPSPFIETENVPVGETGIMELYYTTGCDVTFNYYIDGTTTPLREAKTIYMSNGSRIGSIDEMKTETFTTRYGRVIYEALEDNSDLYELRSASNLPLTVEGGGNVINFYYVSVDATVSSFVDKILSTRYGKADDVMILSTGEYRIKSSTGWTFDRVEVTFEVTPVSGEPKWTFSSEEAYVDGNSLLNIYFGAPFPEGKKMYTEDLVKCIYTLYVIDEPNPVAVGEYTIMVTSEE